MRAITASADIIERAELDCSRDSECVSFFLAETIGEDLRLVDVRVTGPEDFDRRSGVHVSLAEHVRPQLIGWAWEKGLSLVEAHTHIEGDPACLSPTDISGLAEWVPHVRWRLRAAPYAALVIAATTVDGLAWTGPSNTPQAVAALAVDDQPPRLMTGLSLPYMKARIETDG